MLIEMYNNFNGSLDRNHIFVIVDVKLHGWYPKDNLSSYPNGWKQENRNISIYAITINTIRWDTNEVTPSNKNLLTNDIVDEILVPLVDQTTM